MTIGTDVSSVSAHAVWFSGTDHIDLYIWPDNNWEASSLGMTADRESVPGAFGVTGWTVGRPAYVGVEFLDTVTTSYTLYIQAHP
jgi:hypothetical protein